MIGKWFKKQNADRETPGTGQPQTGADDASSRNAGNNSTGNNDAGSNKGKRRRRGQRKSADSASWSVDQFVVEEQEGETRFHDLELQDELMHAIADLGFRYCSPIQSAVLPYTLDGYDAVGKAQTGTGKTAAFLLTAINDLLANPPEQERFVAEPRVVVIAPTRELVMQIAEDAKDLLKYTDIKAVTLIGGVDYGKQLNKVNAGVVDIVVATPGRLLDFMTRRDLYLDHVETLVIDEADRMLDMGFIPQVRRIVRATPPKVERQTLLFSATFTDDVMRLAEQWTVDPFRVEMEPENIAAKTVDQRVYMVSASDKFNLLRNIINSDDVSSVIVFANRRDQTRRLHEKLRKAGVTCGIL